MPKGTGILNLSFAIERIRAMLSADGFEMVESSNFKKFKKVAMSMPGKGLSEQASLDFFDLIDQNAYWIGIYDQDGDCVSLQAARIDELGSMSLAKYWEIQQPRIYPKPNKIGDQHAPTAYKIKGRVLYHGDFFIGEKFRGSGYSGLLIFLGFLVGQAKYDPDWCYGLMSPTLVTRDFPNQANYTIQERRGTHWIKEPKGISGADWLVATQRKNVHHNASLIVNEGIDGFLGRRKEGFPFRS